MGSGLFTDVLEVQDGFPFFDLVILKERNPMLNQEQKNEIEREAIDRIERLEAAHPGLTLL